MTILEMNTGAAILIAVTLALRRALLYRLPKWTFLLLWAVVLCRLLIPFSLPSEVHSCQLLLLRFHHPQLSEKQISNSTHSSSTV